MVNKANEENNMQIRNFNNELRTANILFAGLFRNFRITRSQD